MRGCNVKGKERRGAVLRGYMGKAKQSIRKLRKHIVVEIKGVMGRGSSKYVEDKLRRVGKSPMWTE